MYQFYSLLLTTHDNELLQETRGSDGLMVQWVIGAVSLITNLEHSVRQAFRSL